MDLSRTPPASSPYCALLLFLGYAWNLLGEDGIKKCWDPRVGEMCQMADVSAPTALLSCRRKFGSRGADGASRLDAYLLGRWADVLSLHPHNRWPDYLRAAVRCETTETLPRTSPATSQT
jgi:hypothetical protein